MSLRTALLKVADAARSISGPSGVDIRINQLTIRTRTWSGTMIGLGTPGDVDLVIPAQYPIRFVTEQEIESAGGRYLAGDLLVDHITPYDGVSVGYTPAQLKPSAPDDKTEILYLIAGPHAGEYAVIDLRSFRAFTYQLVLRRKATTP